METVEIAISKIKLNQSNPRVIKDDKFKKLVKSIKEFPEMLKIRPIVVNADMMVLGGNQRLKACREAGLKTVFIIKADELTPEQQQEFIIKDNSGFGEWDFEMLSLDFDPIDLDEWGVDLPEGFGEIEEEVSAEEDDYEIPDEIQTDIKYGDIYQIGEHRLMCGDSTKKEDVEMLMNGELADMVLTDPPYNVDYKGSNGLTIMNDKTDDASFFAFLLAFFTNMAMYSKPGGAWYVWHSDSEGANFRYAMAKAGIMVKQCLIWNKNSLVMGRQDYQWKHEPCLYGWKEGATHHWYSDRKQTTILEFNRPLRSTEHPTMKPIDLLSYQIKNSSKNNDLISDPFLGSGSTMVACHQLNRICYGMELDPKYCQVIIDRMQKLDPEIEIKKL